MLMLILEEGESWFHVSTVKNNFAFWYSTRYNWYYPNLL